MNVKPILFSGPMVRAILDGRKTMTRRVLKPQIVCFPGVVPSFSWGKFSGLFPDDWFGCGNEIDDALPYAPDDILWVRETWRIGAWDNDRGQMCIDFRSDGEADPIWRDVPDPLWFEDNWIKISDELARKGAPMNTEGQCLWKRGEAPLPWRPAICMPRWASRITLTVTDVRVQRLQDISEEDAEAEGAWHWAEAFDEARVMDAPREAFAHLWDSINEKRGFGWKENPWVCVITFSAHKTNVDEFLKVANA